MAARSPSVARSARFAKSHRRSAVAEAPHLARNASNARPASPVSSSPSSRSVRYAATASANRAGSSDSTLAFAARTEARASREALGEAAPRPLPGTGRTRLPGSRGLRTQAACALPPRGSEPCAGGPRTRRGAGPRPRSLDRWRAGARPRAIIGQHGEHARVKAGRVRAVREQLRRRGRTPVGVCCCDGIPEPKLVELRRASRSQAASLSGSIAAATCRSSTMRRSANVVRLVRDLLRCREHLVARRSARGDGLTVVSRCTVRPAARRRELGPPQRERKPSSSVARSSARPSSA